jgi:hypothetical protein
VFFGSPIDGHDVVALDHDLAAGKAFKSPYFFLEPGYFARHVLLRDKERVIVDASAATMDQFHIALAETALPHPLSGVPGKSLRTHFDASFWSRKTEPFARFFV